MSLLDRTVDSSLSYMITVFIDLTQIFYPGNPGRQVLESNRERHDSNHERQKVKNTENKKKTLENESISKQFIVQPLQYNRPKTQTPQNSEGIPLNKSFPLQTEQKELKLK